jgi:hypothetical protein
MQCPENSTDAYDTMQILVLSSRQPNNFRALTIWANSMDEEGEDRLGE